GRCTHVIQQTVAGSQVSSTRKHRIYRKTVLIPCRAVRSLPCSKCSKGCGVVTYVVGTCTTYIDIVVVRGFTCTAEVYTILGGTALIDVYVVVFNIYTSCTCCINTVYSTGSTCGIIKRYRIVICFQMRTTCQIQATGCSAVTEIVNLVVDNPVLIVYARSSTYVN